MVTNLVPGFLAALAAPDPLEAYRRYIDDHFPLLSAYWHNYILDLDSPHADGVMERTIRADRRDLHTLLGAVDVVGIAEETARRCEDVFEIDCPMDVCVMVGVGGANAGELVVRGRGIAFVCLEHFTGRANPETMGLGLSPELLPLWLAHEIAHTVRYGSPESNSEVRRIISDMNGYYDYWETGSRATLRELLVNDGLAVAASRVVCPGHEPWHYFGYGRRQYRRLRELESFLFRHVRDELSCRGLGYRLRFLSGGMSATQRIVGGKVVPERSGYYIGHRMVEALVADEGIARALRVDADECDSYERRSAGQTA